jgi:HEAT repeat protein
MIDRHLQTDIAVSLRELESSQADLRAEAATILARTARSQPETVLPALRQCLDDPVAEVRYSAALALGDLADRDSAEKLAQLLSEDDDPMVRQAAAVSLGVVGDDGVEDALLKATKDPSSDVRFHVAAALPRLKADVVYAPLRLLITDEDPTVRANAVAALGDIPIKKAADEIAGCLNDRYPEVRLEAAIALARMDDTRGVDILARHLQKDAVSHLAAEYLYHRPTTKVLLQLKKRASRWLGNPAAKVWAAGALVKLDDPYGKERLLELLESKKDIIRGLTIEVLGELRVDWARRALAELSEKPAGRRWQSEIQAALA